MVPSQNEPCSLHRLIFYCYYQLLVLLVVLLLLHHPSTLNASQRTIHTATSPALPSPHQMKHILFEQFRWDLPVFNRKLEQHRCRRHRSTAAPSLCSTIAPLTSTDFPYIHTYIVMMLLRYIRPTIWSASSTKSITRTRSYFARKVFIWASLPRKSQSTKAANLLPRFALQSSPRPPTYTYDLA